MKFTPSSASSSSSSSFNENLCKSKGNVFGCFSAVLSRILCSKSLPTHPSDPIETDINQHFSKIDKIGVDGSATPNVVARLMGLDSMPEMSSNLSQIFPVPIPITRSKSMDSDDFREKTEEMQHRRVKTSVSFRETPDFFELEDGDFFVLNFEKRGKNQINGSNFGYSEVGIKGNTRRRRRRDKCGRKQRRNRDEQSKDRVFSNEERLTLKLSPQNPPKIDAFFDAQKQSYHLSPIKDNISRKKEELDGIKARRKKKKEIFSSTDEAECDSDNSSPVSVLDHITDFIISDPEVTTSDNDSIYKIDCHCKITKDDGYLQEVEFGHMVNDGGVCFNCPLDGVEFGTGNDSFNREDDICGMSIDMAVVTEDISEPPHPALTYALHYL
ncbi:hypothetical protein SOVF_183050, partial [Spinacia oleracea]